MEPMRPPRDGAGDCGWIDSGEKSRRTKTDLRSPEPPETPERPGTKASPSQSRLRIKRMSSNPTSVRALESADRRETTAARKTKPEDAISLSPTRRLQPAADEWTKGAQRCRRSARIGRFPRGKQGAEFGEPLQIPAE